mgnify:CR=1 FL=1
MLPNSPHVKEVALGSNGITEGTSNEMTLIDMSSISPLASQEIFQELAKKNIEMLDAPVSGGEPKAVDGTLSVMVGGEKEIFDRYFDILMSMASSVVHVGEIGSGKTTVCRALINQLNSQIALPHRARVRKFHFRLSRSGCPPGNLAS